MELRNHPLAGHEDQAAPSQINPTSVAIGHVILRGTPRGDGSYNAKVPLDAIYTEDVAVDMDHVRELQQSILARAEVNKDSGQVADILLAQVPELDRLSIVDGFHRVRALREMGRQAVLANVRMSCSWEEVFSLRIISASHSSVRFPRIAGWAVEAWDSSPWAGKLEALQAFSLGFNQRMTGANLGLHPAETVAIRRWVEQKSQEWHLKAGTVYRYLNTVRSADPALVQEVRDGKGRSGIPYITPQHLAVIAQMLPGPENYDLQQLIAVSAKEHRLSTPQTRTLSNVAAAAENRREAERLIHQVLQRPVEPNYKANEQRKLDRSKAATARDLSTANQQNALASETAAAEVARAQELTTEITTLRDQLLESELKSGLLSIAALLHRTNAPLILQRRLFEDILKTGHPVIFSHVLQSIPLLPSGLDAPIAEARQRTISPEEQASIERFKRQMSALNAEERSTVVLANLYRLSIRTTAQALGMSEYQVGKLLSSGRAKLTADNQ
jgi:hypothetical protein